jgi:hypothetical protein
METITIEAATPDLGRVLYSALSAFYPELDTDADGNCIVSVRLSSETQRLEVTEAIQLHLADRGDDAVNSVSFAPGNEQHSGRVPRLDDWPRPRLTLIAGGGGLPLPDEDDPSKIYAVQLLLFDGRTSTAGVYDSPTGKFPRVDDVIPVDERGGRARVTAVSRGDHPPIRADLLT